MSCRDEVQDAFREAVTIARAHDVPLDLPLVVELFRELRSVAVTPSARKHGRYRPPERYPDFPEFTSESQEIPVSRGPPCNCL